MQDTPLVSIITPSLNQGRYIRAAIESVQAQDYPHVEYRVLDAGSTDETHAILRASGVDWIARPDAGQADAINRGFAESRGELLAWLNSDDLYLPGALGEMVRYLVDHPDCAMVYGVADVIDADGNYLAPATVEPYSYDRLLNDLDFIPQPATLIRRSAFEAVGGIDTSLRYAFDYDLWLKIGQRFEIGFVDRPLAQLRDYPETKTATGGLDRLLEIERIVRRYGRRPIPTHFRGQMVRARWRAMWRALRFGRPFEAGVHARSGLRHLGAYLGARI